MIHDAPRSWTSVLLGIALAACGIGLASPAGAIDWSSDLEAAKRRAREQVRPVIVDFWASWCDPCLAMDTKTWARPEVAAAAGRFVTARSDYGESGTTISEFYGVASIPATLLLDRSGRVLQRIAGQRTPEDLARLLNAVPGAAEIDSLVTLVTRPPKDPEAAFALIAALHERSLDELAAPVVRALRGARPIKKNPVLRERLEMLAAVTSFQGDPGKAIDALMACLRKYPTGPARRETYAALVRLCARIGARDLALQSLSQMQHEFPDDALTRESESLLASTGD